MKLAPAGIHEWPKSNGPVSNRRVWSLLGRLDRDTRQGAREEGGDVLMAAVVTPFPSRSRTRAGHAPIPPDGRDQRYAAGKALRRRVPREQHGEWTPARNRCDPVE